MPELASQLQGCRYLDVSVTGAPPSGGVSFKRKTMTKNQEIKKLLKELKIHLKKQGGDVRENAVAYFAVKKKVVRKKATKRATRRRRG